MRIKSTETGNAVNGWQTVQTIGSFHDIVIALYDYVMPAMLSERRLKNEQDTGLYRVDRRLYWSCQLGIGLFRLDLVRLIFGDMTWISRIIYVLVGICGIYLLTFLGRVDQEA